MATPGLYLVWTQGTAILVGESNGVFEQNEAVFGISFPNQQTQPLTINLASSAHQNNGFDTLNNTKLYLTGPAEEIAIVQSTWPALGGGLQISFDGGLTYNTFSATYGYQANPATWVEIPAEAMGLNGMAGQLGPYDSANMLLRYVIPEAATQYQIYNVALAADFDVA
ncbi:MAG: hypothetical protein WA766_11770 [Candidatus Acidiferrales bacterium]